MSDAPFLYILMRTDLDSLNPGKAMAQAAHAANQFVFLASHGAITEIKEAYQEWMSQANAFGTTIVLDGLNEDKIRLAVEKASAEGYLSDVTIDPEYPIRDGELVHLIPDFLTCAYVFSHDGSRPKALSEFKLHA